MARAFARGGGPREGGSRPTSSQLPPPDTTAKSRRRPARRAADWRAAQMASPLSLRARSRCDGSGLLVRRPLLVPALLLLGGLARAAEQPPGGEHDRRGDLAD